MRLPPTLPWNFVGRGRLRLKLRNKLLLGSCFGRSPGIRWIADDRRRYVRGFRTQQVGYSQRLRRGSPPIATAGFGLSTDNKSKF